MNICGISVRGLIFNFLLFIFIFFILKNQLFLEDSIKIYEFYIFYLAMYFFDCVAKIDLYFDDFFKINKKLILLILCFYFSVFFYEYIDNILYSKVKFLYSIPTEDDILNSNRWNLNNPLFFLIAFLYTFLLIFIFVIFLPFFSVFEPLFFWFFSFCIFVYSVRLFKLINEEKNKSSKKEQENLSKFNPFILLFLAFILIIDSKNLDFHFKLISFFVFLLIGKYLLNTKNIELEKKVKEFFSKRATNKPFIKPEKSASKTITPIIKKENHVIEKGFSFNFSERLADIFTWKNLKNNQILNYFLFLSLFILFATRFDSIGNIFNIPIFLFLLFLFSGLVLPVYFIQKKILTQINLEKTWEEIIFLSIKTASFVILFGLFSVFLWLIVELLSENIKETMMVIFQYWYKKTFLGWQLNYFIMLSLLSSLFIFLKFLHIQENR